MAFALAVAGSLSVPGPAEHFEDETSAFYTAGNSTRPPSSWTCVDHPVEARASRAELLACDDQCRPSLVSCFVPIDIVNPRLPCTADLPKRFGQKLVQNWVSKTHTGNSKCQTCADFKTKGQKAIAPRTCPHLHRHDAQCNGIESPAQ
eukprot:4583567-Amphidinium_carterae.1